MAWETITPKRRRACKASDGCSMCVTSRSQEVRKDGSNNSSRMQIDIATMDRLRLKLGDRIAWLVDKDRKAVALVLDEKGTSTICLGSSKSSRKLRLHVPKEVSEYMRQVWGVGKDEEAHTFAIELALSGGYIELKRKGD